MDSIAKGWTGRFASRPYERATRRTAPRSLGGCRTCKKRHVKCGEEKPECQRCRKWQGFCGGYDTDKPLLLCNTQGNTQDNTPVAARNVQRTGATSVLGSQLSVPTPFRSQLEKAYFESWVRLSKDICGDGLSELCSGTITRLSFEDPMIRDALLAVGALQSVLERQPDAAADRGSLARQPGYAGALARYDTALRRVVRAPMDADMVRTVLLCCALFVCFDLLDGNRRAVHGHIFHGLRILRRCLRSAAPGADLGACTSSPAPRVVDDPVIQLFQRLTMVSHAHLALQAEMVWQSRLSGPRRPRFPAAAAVPARFRDAAEAARWLDAIYKCLLDATRSFGGAVSEFASDPAWRRHRAVLLRLLGCWESGFAPVLDEARRGRDDDGNNNKDNKDNDDDDDDDDRDRFSRALLLRMQWIVAYTAAYASQCSDYGGLVDMEPWFREIVVLAERLPRTRRAKVTPFTISSPVFALFLSGFKCRSKTVRADAERVLARFNTQVDGLWDARAALALVRWGRELEAEYAGLITDPEVAWAKVRQRYVVFSDRESSATVGAPRLRGDTWVIEEETITW